MVASVVRPLLVRDEVAVIVPPVIVPPVIDEKNDVIPWMIEAMRPVVVVVAVSVRLLALIFPDAERLVVEAFPSTV